MKNLKNILLATAASAAICASSTAFAGAADTFYGKVAVSANKLNKTSYKDYGLDKDNKVIPGSADSYKLKSKTNFAGELEAGYNYMDNVRVGVAFSHYFNPELKKNNQVTEDTTLFKVTDSVKAKAKVNALLAKAYADVADLGMVKLFVGAGLGVSQASAKVDVKYESYDKANSKALPAITRSYKLKKKTNFAYELIAGVSAEMAPGIHGEFFYAWKDLGKTKGLTDTTAKYKADKLSFKGHNLGLGVRFDI